MGLMRASARIAGFCWFLTLEILAMMLDTKEIPTEERLTFWYPNQFVFQRFKKKKAREKSEERGEHNALHKWVVLIPFHIWLRFLSRQRCADHSKLWSYSFGLSPLLLFACFLYFYKLLARQIILIIFFTVSKGTCYFQGITWEVHSQHFTDFLRFLNLSPRLNGLMFVFLNILIASST